MAGTLATLRRGYQVKAALEGSNALGFPVNNTTSWWRFLRSSNAIDVTSVGDGLGNSIVTNTLMSKARAFTEPPVREYIRVDGQEDEVPESEAARLIEQPNTFMDSDLLWLYAMMSIAAAGNAFLHKLRDGRGKPFQLWPLYPQYMDPRTPQDGSAFMTHWKYSIPNRPEVDIPVEDVIHLRVNMDRTDHRVGYPQLGNVLADIYGDEEALRFSTALLVNMGVPGVIMSPRDPADPGPGPETRASIRDEYKAKFGGNKRGEPLIIGGGGGMDLQVVSFSPQAMNFNDLRRVPEERVSGALGWPAILAGLGAGLDRSAYSNAEQLREFATEQTLLPEWRMIGRQLTRQLLPEFRSPGQLGSRSLRFDTKEVRALQEDEDEAVDRISKGVTAGWAMVSEARRAAGLTVEDEHEVFLRTPSMIEVTADGEIPGLDDADDE